MRRMFCNRSSHRKSCFFFALKSVALCDLSEISPPCSFRKITLKKSIVNIVS